MNTGTWRLGGRTGALMVDGLAYVAAGTFLWRASLSRGNVHSRADGPPPGQAFCPEPGAMLNNLEGDNYR